MKICFTLLDIMFTELFLHLSEEDEHVGKRHVAKLTIADHRSSFFSVYIVCVLVLVGKIIFSKNVACSPYVCIFVLGGKDLFF